MIQTKRPVLIIEQSCYHAFIPAELQGELQIQVLRPCIVGGYICHRVIFLDAYVSSRSVELNPEELKVSDSCLDVLCHTLTPQVPAI